MAGTLEVLENILKEVNNVALSVHDVVHDVHVVLWLELWESPV